MPTLNWEGKQHIVNHYDEVSLKNLQLMYKFKSEEELDSKNKIIHGDNLEALKLLLPQFRGKINCIYIDPPYNTGKRGQFYLDRVINDNIKDKHDRWLCMMYPRLKLMHSILAEDGAIFISIDEREQAHLRLLCDEIFGGSNFVNNIIWQKKYSPQNDARYFSDAHDFIVCYTKDKKKWKRNLLPRTAKQNDRYKVYDNDPRGVWMPGDLSVKTYNSKTDYPIVTPSGRKVMPPAGRCWCVSRERLQEMINDNRIWFGKDRNNTPLIKRFLSEVQDGIVPVTLWLRDDVGDNNEAKRDLKNIFGKDVAPFVTPKPSRLIERILQIGSKKDSIILDSFAGSGTTAQAVLNINKKDGGNRNFVLIENGAFAEEITA